LKKRVKKQLVHSLNRRDWLTEEETELLLQELALDEAPRIVCRNCGYGKKRGQWTPDPQKWRGNPEENFLKYKGQDVRLMFCPNCGAKNYISMGYALHILNWWTQYKRIANEFREEQRAMRAKAVAR
jgi:hypothetical protein